MVALAAGLALFAGLALASAAQAQPGDPAAVQQGAAPQSAGQGPPPPPGSAPVGVPGASVQGSGAAGGSVDASTAEQPVVHSSPWAAWDAGDYAQALRGFTEQQTRRPDDPSLSLNTGAAHYRLQDFESADAQFHRAASIGDDALRAEALYNLGNSAFRQGKLGEAADYYMASLEANPVDLDAKFNLEFVRQELERQPPEQGEQNQDRQQDQQDDQQDQQQDSGQQQQDGDDQEDQEGNESPPADQEGQQQGQQDPSDPEDQYGEDQQQGAPDGDGHGAEAPAPGMTPEEAERTLRALEEGRPDPTRRGQRGQRSRQARDW